MEQKPHRSDGASRARLTDSTMAFLGRPLFYNRRHRTSTQATWLSCCPAVEHKGCGKNGGALTLQPPIPRADDGDTARAPCAKLSSYVAILPWVRVAHLASHLLAQATRRLSADWQVRYGYPVWLVETFVELDRFAGTAYRAAGWLPLGPTTGRTRQDRQRTLHHPFKSVWVRPLHPAFRQHLTPP